MKPIDLVSSILIYPAQYYDSLCYINDFDGELVDVTVYRIYNDSSENKCFHFKNKAKNYLMSLKLKHCYQIKHIYSAAQAEEFVDNYKWSKIFL